MLFLFSSFVFLIFCFLVFNNPVSMVGVLMLMSLSFVGMLSFYGSFWYSYILFLIYVGGLLVLFIYICLVSSNFSLSMNFELLMLVLTVALLSSFSDLRMKPVGFLGQSSWSSGFTLIDSSNTSIYLFLVMVLLFMLLVVIRTLGIGSSLVVNESS